MSKMMKPVVVIILAVAVAAGAAALLSRQSEESTETATAISSNVDFKSAGGGRFRGPEDAEVTLVEFGDYQCPSCAAYHPFVKEILNRYPKQLRLEFRHFPLVTIHPNAMAAHKAVEAAGEQGRYWEMHDAVFDYQSQWAGQADPRPVFAAIANRIGINGAILVQTMDSPRIQERILKDVELGDKVNVQAVPTFVIDGQQVHIKLSMEDFVRTVESHLNK